MSWLGGGGGQGYEDKLKIFLGPISFIFMQFSAKILPNDRLAHYLRGLRPPPSGKFLIRHCKCQIRWSGPNGTVLTKFIQWSLSFYFPTPV